MMGKTNPADALPGTIRGDFGVNVAMNIIHGSDSPESAERELALWFTDEELLNYEKTINRWI
jgi:nucleoside-diphosphate kinase